MGILSGARPGGLSGWRAYLMTGLLSDGGLAFWLAGFLAGGLSGWRAFWMHSVMEVLCNIERKRITISIIIGIYSGS